MERTSDFIERLRVKNGGCTDYRISRILETTQSAIIRWKNGTTMNDEYAIKTAKKLEIDPAYVLACVAAERSQNVESKEHWERIASKFAA